MDAKLLAGHFHPDWLEARLQQDDIEFLEA
jgi:hypothetical protein